MREITKAGPLLDSKGNLMVSGWARQPLLDANLENVNIYPLKFLQPLRIKRWQYYGITMPTHFFSFTISHVGYLASIFAYVVDFAARKCQEETLTVPFGSGVVLPRSSTSGDCHYQSGSLRLDFYVKSDNLRVLDIRWPNFGGKGLKANIELALKPGHESVVNVFPYPNRRFFYTRKVNCMPASGTVEYDREHRLSPDDSLGVLDWGVGIWPYRTFWIWGSSSQFLPDGRTIGLNLGGGIGNDPEVTDNALILDGKVHKLGIVDFEYNDKDLSKPWRMSSKDGRLELDFLPFFERVAKTDFKVLSSEVHQVFGHYSGTAVLDDGTKLALKDLIGWVEVQRAKW